MGEEYHPVDLFGGAITTDLPTSFTDVSNIRQIPDHQEVHISQNGYTSLVVEILERVTHTSTDSEALKYHFGDLTDEDPTTKIWTTNTARLVKHPEVPVHSLIATAPPGEQQRGRTHEPDFVAILMTVVRLVGVETDLLVVANVPHVREEGAEGWGETNFEQGKYGRLVEEGLKIRNRVLDTLEVKDWGLFGGE